MKNLIRAGKSMLCLILFASFLIPASAQGDSSKNLPNFLLSEFTKGIVKLKSGQTNTAVLNYNIVDQEMVFLQSDRYMVLDNPQLVDTIYLANRTFVPFKTGFNELVMTGPATLFIQHRSEVVPVGATTGYGVTSQTTGPSYVRQVYGPTGSVNFNLPEGFKLNDKTDYWAGRDNSMERFSNKRQFLKIFKDKSKELDQFIGSKHIDFKNLSDLVKLFNYCNEIYR